NYVTLLADDADPSCLHDTTFTHSAEYLANTIKQKYPHINIDKIYADAYVEQSGAIGSFYPDANNAIKKRMDYGCLLFNYIGHGSLQYIGTERYVTETEVSNYTNHQQHTILVTSTCTYGKYDIPGETCGAEMWLHAQGGAIASLSPARPISHNESFNTMLCSLLTGGQVRIGDALRNAKNAYNVSHSITLLGDPALMPSVPQYNAVVTAINNRPVTDSVADSVMVLSEVVVEGEIRQDSLCVSNFNGTLFASVYDRESKALTLGNDNEDSEVQFSQQKSLLYKGSTTIANGKFQYRFIVPRDVAYNYEQGKISHYARSTDGTDASGVYQNIYFGGFDTTLTISEFRPQIRLYMGDTLFRDGGLTDDSPTLIALISDSVGINAVGSGIGHDITAVIDNKPNTLVVLNDFYEPDITNSHNGQLRYAFDNLEQGYHSITFKAWNIYNYSNSATIHFIVTGQPSSGDVSFFAYPNPASTNTQLRIELSDTQKLSSAEISIYSYTGTLVTTLHPTINNDSYVVGPCSWNLTNAVGAMLHSGIYIARMILTTTDGETISKQCKIVIQH
ncbi:MAG: type IX secretion system sortase PorU, partial [Bacteroidales bacterium]|nr:type IX secretion system sortase PorU [Candidatus Colimorpha onthohippi]